MSDYSELKRVAEAVLAMNYPWVHTVRDGRLGKTSTEYARLAHPSNVLALIAEIEQDEMHLRAFGSVAETAIAERDQLKAENAGLKTGYEAYEQVNAELKAEVEGLRKDSESYRLLSFCHGQGTLELVRSHHELCAEIRRLKILAGEPVPQTPEEFVGPSPEGPTARIRRKLADLGQGEQS